MRDRLVLWTSLPPLGNPIPGLMCPWANDHAILKEIIKIRHRPGFETHVSKAALPRVRIRTISTLNPIVTTSIRRTGLPGLCLLAPLRAIHERIVHAAHLLVYVVASVRDTRDRHQHQENNQTKHMPTPVSTRIQRIQTPRSAPGTTPPLGLQPVQINLGQKSSSTRAHQGIKIY